MGTSEHSVQSGKGRRYVSVCHPMSPFCSKDMDSVNRWVLESSLDPH
jgi:hypothetical protein